MTISLCENLIYAATKHMQQLMSHLRMPLPLPWLSNSYKKITSVGLTDIGLRRPNNEDAFVTRPKVGFSLVADGMGGAAAGEVASKIFSDTAIEVFLKTEDRNQEEAAQLIQRTFELANRRMLEHVLEYPSHRGMGCTAELIAFSKERFVIGHVGDSRTYRFRNGKLAQLTEDHSFVQEQLKLGFITPEQAKKHEMRNVILRAVGVEENPKLDLIRGKTYSNDIFLLCSDGLTDFVEDTDIHQVLSDDSESLQRKAKRLINLAKSTGGHDNITVVLIVVE